MDRKFFPLLKHPFCHWWNEIVLSSKNLFNLFPPHAYLPAWFVGTAAEVTFFSLLGYAAGQARGMRFALLGNCVAIIGRRILTRVAGMVANEKWQGTLLYLIVAPIKYTRFIIGRSILSLLEGAFTSLAVFLVIVICLGFLPEHASLLWWYPLIMCAVSLSMIGLGTLVADLTFYFRTSMYVSSSFWMCLMIFCGVIFPLSSLPAWMRAISYCLPMTNAILSLRALMNGTLSHLCVNTLLRELAIGIIYLSAGSILLKIMVGIGIRRGTLDVF